MVTVVTPTLPAFLEKLGWDPEPYDICWLDCERVGFLLARGDTGWETCLCIEHATELEESSQNGYSIADPPRYSRAKWWPWRNAGSDREASGLDDPFAD